MEKINIIEEKENPLFKRKEIKFSVDAEITPSHPKARKIISENFSTSEENIRIKNILGKFGSKNFTISAHIYASEQDKLDTEGQSKKDAVAQPEQAGHTPLQNPEDKPEAPAEAPTETAPATETPVEQPKLPEPVQETPAQETTPETSKSEEPNNKPKESIEPKPTQEEKTE